jgi:hypothetical protein
LALGAVGVALAAFARALLIVPHVAGLSLARFARGKIGRFVSGAFALAGRRWRANLGIVATTVIIIVAVAKGRA